MATQNYLTMSDSEIANFTYSVRDELHANIPPDVMLDAIQSGDTVIHQYPEGFCVIRRYKSSSPYLWVMYVDPDERGHDVGAAMLQDIECKYASAESIGLQCHESLQPYYEKRGFHPVLPYDDFVEMSKDIKEED